MIRGQSDPAFPDRSGYGLYGLYERRPYSVTSSLIGWAHTQNDPWSAPGIGVFYSYGIQKGLVIAPQAVSIIIIRAHDQTSLDTTQWPDVRTTATVKVCPVEWLLVVLNYGGDK